MTKAKEEYSDPERIRKVEADLASLYQTWRILDFGDFLLNSPSVGRFPLGTGRTAEHALLFIDRKDDGENDYWIVDGGSGASTAVEQKDGSLTPSGPTQAVQVKKNQVVRLGGVRMKLVRPEAPESDDPKDAFEILDTGIYSLPISPQAPGTVYLGRDPGPGGIKLGGADREISRRHLEIGATAEGYWVREANDCTGATAYLMRNNVIYKIPAGGWLPLEAGDTLLLGKSRSHPRYGREEIEKKMGELYEGLNVQEEIQKEIPAWPKNPEEPAPPLYSSPLHQYFMTRDDLQNQAVSYAHAYRITPDFVLEYAGEIERPAFPHTAEPRRRGRIDHFPAGTDPFAEPEPEVPIVVVEEAPPSPPLPTWEEFLSEGTFPTEDLHEPLSLMLRFEEEGTPAHIQIQRAITTLENLLRKRIDPAFPEPPVMSREEFMKVVQYVATKKAIPLFQEYWRKYQRLHARLHQAELKLSDSFGLLSAAENEEEARERLERLQQEYERLQNEMKNLQQEMKQIRPADLEEDLSRLSRDLPASAAQVSEVDLNRALQDPDLRKRAVKGLIRELYPSLYCDPVSEILPMLARSVLALAGSSGAPLLETDGTLSLSFLGLIKAAVDLFLDQNRALVELFSTSVEELKKESDRKLLDLSLLTERTREAIAL